MEGREGERIKGFLPQKEGEGGKREERGEKEELRKGSASRSEGAMAILLQAVAASRLFLLGHRWETMGMMVVPALGA